MTKASNTPRATSGKGRIQFTPYVPGTPGVKSNPRGSDHAKATPKKRAGFVISAAGKNECVWLVESGEGNRLFDCWLDAMAWAKKNGVRVFSNGRQCLDYLNA